MKILFGAVVLMVVSILMLLYSTKELENRSQIEKSLRIMPKIQGEVLIVSDSDRYFMSKVTTIIIFFNSGCEHCQHEAQIIQQAIPSFSGINLLFTSEEPKENIIAFSKANKLDNKTGVWWIKMQPDDVYKTFGNIGTPHIWIYNKDGQLVKEFRGLTEVEDILEWL